MNKTTRLFALASVAAAALCTQAHAGGFYIQEEGARGAGRAYSGEVADQGVESLWWNPAAIAGAGRELYVGANGVFVDGRVANTGSSVTYPGGITAPVQGQPRAFNPILPGLVPNFAVAIPLSHRFSVGLSGGAPFNFTTKYDPNAFTRYDALTSMLRTEDIQGTVAMKVNDWLSIGAGGDAQYTKARLSNASPNLSPLLPDGTQSLEGSGWNWGWNAGAQAHLGRLTLGGSYRSKMDHDLSGSVAVSGLLGPLAAANVTGGAKAHFTTPWIATAGLRYQLTDKLTLNGQVQRFGWSEFQAITISTAAGTQVLAQNYHDTTTGAVGLDYAVNNALTLRAGGQWDPTPTPNDGRTARVPDGDRWLMSVGATGKVSDHMKVDAAFTYVAFKDSNINHEVPFYAGTPAATTASLQGAVQGTGYVLSLGLRDSF